MKSVLVNIGLATNDGKGVTSEQVRAALDSTGVSIVRDAVRQSGTEPTFVAELSRALSDEEAAGVSWLLDQEAIAQCVDGAGELHGPKAANWRPFNPEYFLTLG